MDLVVNETSELYRKASIASECELVKQDYLFPKANV
jgi:hypothetical protein